MSQGSFAVSFKAPPAMCSKRARQSYLLWKENPGHPGVQFKRVHPKLPVYSVRIGIGWRAVGAREGETMVWSWIGSHAGYDSVLRRL